MFDRGLNLPPLKNEIGLKACAKTKSLKNVKKTAKFLTLSLFLGVTRARIHELLMSTTRIQWSCPSFFNLFLNLPSSQIRIESLPSIVDQSSSLVESSMATYWIGWWTLKVLDSLFLIDKSYLKGVLKLWINQNLLIPCIKWPISIYEVSLEEAQCLEGLFSVKIRKLFGLHQSTANMCL